MSLLQILLIEDNPGDARLIREMLHSGQGTTSFRLETCKSLQQGLEMAEQIQFHLVLLDLTLPDSSGIETLLRLREAIPDLAIVVLTGFEDAELGVVAVQKGAQDYLTKDDVNDKLLVKSIRYAIERQRVETTIKRGQQEYRSLIDDVFHTSMVSVLILDASYTVVWCNAATEVYFGIDREDLLGEDKRVLVDTKLKCIFADPDDYANRLLEAYQNQTFTDRFECHVIPGKNREERWLEHWSQPITSGLFSGGRIEQYNDITDRKILEFAEREQRGFAEALQDITKYIASTLDLQDVLGRILENIHNIVEHTSASVGLLEDDKLLLARTSSSKDDTQEIYAERRLQDAPFLQHMIMSQKPIIVNDLQGIEEVRALASAANAASYMGVPIQLRNQVIGFLNIFSDQLNYFRAEVGDRLLAFAELAAIAIENARLFEQTKEFATLQERQRLARDLHDSVSQTLFTCRTMTEAALRRLDRDPEQAREFLQEAHELTITALSEMRVLLLELRPSTLTQVTLTQLFEQYLQPLQNRRDFELVWNLDNVPAVSPHVKIAMYRIVQEALNNIDKHARATLVEIHLHQNHGFLEITVKDNGIGFDIQTVDATSLGLNIMRERADEIGAELTIESQPNGGTLVRIKWEYEHDYR